MARRREEEPRLASSPGPASPGTTCLGASDLPDLSVVYVAFRNLAEITGSIASVRCAARAASPEISVEVLVIDNESPGGTAALAGADDVRVIPSPGNPGFAAACNLGLDAARGTWVLLLNPDTRVPEQSLEVLLAEAARLLPSGAALFGCRQLGPDGETAETAYPAEVWPGPEGLLAAVPGLRLLMPARWQRAKDPRTRRAAQHRTHATAAVQGSFLLAPRLLLTRLGRLDPDFFLYFEELDGCARIGARGFSVVHLAEAAIEHTGAAGPRDPTRQRQFYVSEQLFVRKQRGCLAALAVLALRQTAHVLRREPALGRAALVGTFAARVQAALSPTRRPGSRPSPLRV